MKTPTERMERIAREALFTPNNKGVWVTVNKLDFIWLLNQAGYLVGSQKTKGAA